MLKNILHILHRAVHHNSGNVSIILAMTAGIVSLMTYSTIDYNRVTHYKTITQSALDAAIIAGILETTGSDARADLAAVTAKAQSVFNANTANISDVVTFKNFTVSGNGGVYTANVNFAVNRIFSKGLANEVKFDGNNNLSATAERPAPGETEVVIAVDTSFNANITAPASALNELISTLYGSSNRMDNLVVSLIPYGDSVRIGNEGRGNIGVNWVMPVPRDRNTGWQTSNGCFTSRAVDYSPSESNIASYSDASSPASNRVPLYSGPFTRYADYQVRSVPTAGSPTNLDVLIAPSGGFTFIDTDADFADNLRIRLTSNIGLVLGTGTINPPSGSSAPWDTSGATLTPLVVSEGRNSLDIQFNATYKRLLYSQLIFTPQHNGFPARTFLGTPAVRYQTSITGDFGGTRLLDNINFRYYDIHSVPVIAQRGNFLGLIAERERTNFSGNPTFTQVQVGHSRYNSAYHADSVAELHAMSFEFGCTISEAYLFGDHKRQLESAVSGMLTSNNKDGPARTQVGMGWAYYALSSNWRGNLPAKSGNSPETEYPKDAGMGHKIAILINSAANYGPHDNEATTALCDNMKADGIEIYTIAYNASALPALQKTALESCATDPNTHYFEDPSVSALSAAFNDIKSNIGSNDKEDTKVKLIN